VGLVLLQVKRFYQINTFRKKNMLEQHLWQWQAWQGNGKIAATSTNMAPKSLNSISAVVNEMPLFWNNTIMR
jgi:hypothetical protein